MTRLIARPLAALLVALATVVPCASAVERIVDFASDVTVRADGSLLVAETISVQVDGNRIKRGIYRDFPTRYDNHRGARVVVPFEVLDVQRDGQPEHYSIEQLANGVRVRIGRAEHLLTPGRYAYNPTTRQITWLTGYFAERGKPKTTYIPNDKTVQLEVEFAAASGPLSWTCGCNRK